MSRRNKSIISKRKKKVNIDLILRGVFFLLAVFCSFYSMRQYYSFVVIKFSHLLIVSLVSGVFFALLFYRYEKRAEGVSFKIWDHFGRCVIIFGPICCSVLLLANEYLSKHNEYKQTVLILEKHEEYKRSPNHVVVKIEGIEQDINFSNKDFQEISMARFVNLRLKKGFLGVILIKEAKLGY